MNASMQYLKLVTIVKRKQSIFNLSGLLLFFFFFVKGIHIFLDDNEILQYLSFFVFHYCSTVI